MISRNLKYFLFTIIWGAYFLCYFYFNQEIITRVQTVEYGEIVFSLISSMIAMCTIYSILSLILSSTRKFVNLSIHLSSIIKKILLVFLWIVWWITIISNLWYDVSALIAWAWIGWLALALWAQKSLTNVFWAITIVLNKPFIIWDFVKIENTIWVVKDIWISYLTLVDKAGHQVMIPNEAIMTSFVENYSIRDNRRTDFIIGLEYNTSQEMLKKSVEIIETNLQKYVEEKTVEKYRVNFDNFWEYSLDINVTYFSLVEEYPEYLKQKEQINLEINNLLKKESINIAFPTRHLIIEN